MNRVKQGLKLARTSDRRKIKRGRRILVEQGFPLGYARLDWAMQEFSRALDRVAVDFARAGAAFTAWARAAGTPEGRPLAEHIVDRMLAGEC